MDKQYLLRLCEDIRADKISCEEAAELLKELPFKNMEFARIDNHRSLRTGYPEVVFCQGKTDSQIADIMELLWQKNNTVIYKKSVKIHNKKTILLFRGTKSKKGVCFWRPFMIQKSYYNV